MKILSNIKNNLTWNISNKSELKEEDKIFIENFYPQIYHNDLTCKLWSFDEKLPSGKWLENIVFNNELTNAKALVL
jgi:hypothetical protein